MLRDEGCTMKSFAFQRTGLLERLKELNGYSEGIITDSCNTISPPPLKEFSITSISANVLLWLNCSCRIPSWKTKYSLHYFLKCYALKTGGIITLYCAVPAPAQRTIWWLHKDLLKEKRQIVSLLAFTNPRAQPLQFGNTELSHYFLGTFQIPSLQLRMRTTTQQ